MLSTHLIQHFTDTQLQFNIFVLVPFIEWYISVILTDLVPKAIKMLVNAIRHWEIKSVGESRKSRIQ